MEIIGVGRSKTWDWLSGLSPGGCVFGVRVSDAANSRKLVVEQEVGGKIGGGPQVPFYDLASQIGYNHMLGFELIVRDTAWFDGHEAFHGRDAADIAKGVED